MITLSSTTRETRSRSRVYSHNPMIEVEIYTRVEGQISVGQQVRRYISTRSLEAPGATARIALQGKYFLGQDRTYLNTAEIRRVVQTGDMVKVWIRDATGVRRLDLIGTVRNLTLSEIEISGSPEHRVEMEVLSIGQALIDYQVFWHPHIATRNNFGGIGYLARSKGQIPSGRPDEVIKAIYDTFLNDAYIYRFTDGRSLRTALAFRGEAAQHGATLMAFSALGMDGPLWATMKRYADQPWNELFVDVQQEIPRVLDEADELGATDTEAIYFRPTPWGIQRWNALADTQGWGFVVEDDERMDDGFDLTRTDGSVYNFFWTPGKGIFSAFDQLSILYNRSDGLLPIYDADSIRRYGLRRLEQATEYVQFVNKANEQTSTTTAAQQLRSNSKKPTLWQMLAIRTLQMYQWNGYENFFQGQITTRGRIGPDRRHGARVGSVLTRSADGWQYYVTQLMQVYSYPDQHTTRWVVAKGRSPTDYETWWRQQLGAYQDRLSTKMDLATLRQAGLYSGEDNL